MKSVGGGEAWSGGGERGEGTGKVSGRSGSGTETAAEFAFFGNSFCEGGGKRREVMFKE